MSNNIAPGRNLKTSFWHFLLAIVLSACASNGSAPAADNEGLATAVPTGTPTAEVEAPAAPLSIASISRDPVGLYELLELEIRTDVEVENPFDREQIDMRLVFTGPSGADTEVGAFWYREYRQGSSVAVGEAGWRARFSPTEVGDWTAVARIPAQGLESEPLHFHVVPSNNPGFVRIHPDNPRYFAFDNGDFFFPIGVNMAWWTGAGNAIPDYKRWFDAFASHGGNTVRVWMAEWSFGIEWRDTPLGDYTKRLRQAWLLDQIFAMAEERDIYIILVLLNCADFNNWQTNGWNNNPYNAELGGPLENPSQYVIDKTARALLQRRLDYIAARWGYSPNLLAWEWWNEVNLAPFTDETLIPWLQEMGSYLRAQDINQHLITNSYAIRDRSPIWELSEIDIIQKHEYAIQVESPIKDMTERVVKDFQRLTEGYPVKPVILGEFGYGGEGDINVIEKTGIHLHNGIWATTFAGYAGSGMYWFWDVYIEAHDAWRHFRGLHEFLTGIDLSRYEPFSPMVSAGADDEQARAVGLGLRGEDVLVWLRNTAYTTEAAISAWERVGRSASFMYVPPWVEGQRLILTDLQAGRYIVHWFDPQSGNWLEEIEIESIDGALFLTIPQFRRDLAARITRLP